MIREVVSPEVSFGIGAAVLFGALIYGVARAGRLGPRERAQTDAGTRVMQKSQELQHSRSSADRLTMLLFALVGFGLLCLIYSGYDLGRDQSRAAAASGTSANTPTASAESGSPDLHKGVQTNKGP